MPHGKFWARAVNTTAKNANKYGLWTIPGSGVCRTLGKFKKMYVEAIDQETADKIVHVLCIAAKCPALQYYFLTDHVCNALGIKHYYNLTNPKKKRS